MRHFSYKLYHQVIMHDSLYPAYHELKKSQYFSKEELDKLQLSSLKNILTFAFENTDYYNSLFKKIDFNPYQFDLNDFQRIPFLTKDIVNKNFNDLIPKNSKRKREITATSGTTGAKFSFIRDKESATYRHAYMLRFYDWLKLDHSCKKMTIWGARWDVNKTQNFKSGIKKWAKNSYVFSGYQLTSENIKSYLDFIIEKKVKFLVSYPSILEFMANEIEKREINFQPEGLIIQSAGEKLYEQQRIKFQKIFKSEIWDFYGARDIPFIAHECEQHKSLHIAAENVFIEIINSNGMNVMDEEGEIIATDFHNYVMPLIRYKIGDTGSLSPDACKCGRTLPLLKEVSGRTFDIIQFPNGNSVGGTFWPLLFKSKKGIEQFQVIQDSLDHLTIKYIPNEYFEPSLLDHYSKTIYEFAGSDIKIQFEKVNNIEFTEAGKFKYIISLIKP